MENRPLVGLALLCNVVVFVVVLATGLDRTGDAGKWEAVQSASADPPLPDDLTRRVKQSAEGTVLCRAAEYADSGPGGGPTVVPCPSTTRTVHMGGLLDGGFVQGVCYGGKNVSQAKCPIQRCDTCAGGVEYVRAGKLYCVAPTGTGQRVSYSCLE